MNRYIETWFDDDRMTGSVQHKVAEGIDNTKCVVVFVTQRYLDKVNSDDINDNCNFEFGYVVRKRGNNIITVCMEHRLRNPLTWSGKEGAALGGWFALHRQRHVNVNHTDPVAFARSCDELKNTILTFV